MKTLLFKSAFFSCILLIMLNYPGFSQEYIPFPTEKALWVHEVQSPQTSDPPSYELFFLDGDTIINGIVYSMVWLYPGSHSRFVFGIFEENKKVYCTAIDEYFASSWGAPTLLTDSIVLMYDFTVEAGDTIDYFSDDLGLVAECENDLVQEIGYKKIFGEKDRRYYKMMQHNVYEGIGSDLGLYYTIVCHGEGGGHLVCFDEGYENIEDSECYQMLFTLVKEQQLRPIKVYPNPTSNKLYFETETVKNYQLTITNTLGQEVKTTTLAPDNSVTVNELHRGVYLYRLYRGEELLQFGRFVKE